VIARLRAAWAQFLDWLEAPSPSLHQPGFESGSEQPPVGIVVEFRLKGEAEHRLGLTGSLADVGPVRRRETLYLEVGDDDTGPVYRACQVAEWRVTDVRTPAMTPFFF
jgi:hypothetical protein